MAAARRSARDRTFTRSDYQRKLTRALIFGERILRERACTNPEGDMEMKRLKELLLQSLEHETGGVKVYETAVKCAQNEDLKEEWEKYHQETEHHVEVLHGVFSVLGFDTEEKSPGRKIVHDMGAALVAAMEAALAAGDPAAAQIVAGE